MPGWRTPWCTPLLLAALSVVAMRAGAFDLPPGCAGQVLSEEEAKLPVDELRRQVESIEDTDPKRAVRILCSTIPRVERERGAQSPEFAWWVSSLASPFIAYLDRLDEALPLLGTGLAIFDRDPEHYGVEIADIHAAYGWIYYSQGRLAQSGDAWEDALRIRERLPGRNSVELAKVLNGLGRVRMAQRDYAAAQHALDRALAIATANHTDDGDFGAGLENALANLYLRLEKFELARQHILAELRIEEQMPGSGAQRTVGHILLGTVLEKLERFDEAEAELRKALALSDTAQGPVQKRSLRALNRLAALLQNRDRPREALPYAERALRVAEQVVGADAPTIVAMLVTLASLQQELGDLPGADRLYQRAEAIERAHPNDVERQVRVALHRDIASLALDLGEPDQARAQLDQALDAAGEDPGLAVERALTVITLARMPGVAAVDGTRLERSLAELQARLPATHPIVLRVVDQMCARQIATAAPPAACTQALKRVAAEDVEPSLRSAVYADLSRLASSQGDEPGAFARALQALASAQALDLPGPLWRAEFRLANLLHARGDLSFAVFFGKLAVTQIEDLRGRFVGDDRHFDRAFIGDKSAVYRAVADWLMEGGRFEEGLEMLRLLKREEFADFTTRAAELEPGGAGVSFTGAEERLQRAYRKAVESGKRRGRELERLDNLESAHSMDADERARRAQLLADARGAEDGIALRLREFLAASQEQRSRTARPAPAMRAFSLARELQRYGPNTAIAVYLLTDRRLRILMVSARSQEQFEAPVDGAALQRDIGELLSAVSRREPVEGKAQALYLQVARALDERARRDGVQRIVLWLDGPLRYLPFAALHDGQDFLVSRYAFQRYAAPSEDVPVARPELQVRGLGVTRAIGGFAPLPGVADELCDIVRGPIKGLSQIGADCATANRGAGALPGEGFADSEFTQARLRSVLDERDAYSVLHISSHFRLRPGNALRSFLLLGDGERLTLDEIGGLKFSGIRLVTLSACQSALAGAATDDGREIDGFSDIVQRRGAREVIASLWQVEDRSTAALMHELYRELAADGGDGPSALRAAQLWMRSRVRGTERPFEHPYYWAGFVATAD